MSGGLKVLGLITARGGSKGVPNKNLRRINGRSLIERTVAVARGAACLDRIVLSTDDAEIISAAIAIGCDVPFIRPPELSSDEARSIDVVRHALETLPEVYDLIVVLQPTSPLRRSDDIDGAVGLCVESGAPACVSVCQPDKPPHWSYVMAADGTLDAVLSRTEPETRRQDLPAIHAVNGAVYVARTGWILEHDSFVGPGTVGYVMPKDRSVDIDEELDIVVAEAIERWQGEAAAKADSDPDSDALGAGPIKNLLNKV